MLKFLALAALAALTSSTSIGCAPGGFNSVNGNYNALIKSNGNRVHGSYNLTLFMDLGIRWHSLMEILMLATVTHFWEVT